MKAQTPLTDEERLRRARNAKALIEDPLLQECFEVLRERLFELWAESDSLDQAGRESFYHQIHGLDAARALLRKYVDDGTVLTRTHQAGVDKGDAAYPGAN